MKRSVRFLALAAGLLLSAAAQANTVTILNGAAEKGTLSDLGISVTFLGYTAQGVLDMMVTPLFLVAEARVPATHRGTVFAFFSTCFMAMQLLGALVAGALTELVGIEAAFALTCLPTVLVGLGTWRLLRPETAAVLPQPAEVPAAAAAA